MAYKLIICPEAEDDILHLDSIIRKRILKKLRWLFAQPNPFLHAKPLHGSAAGDIRFRIGDYRVIAAIDENKKMITITAVGHRKDVYAD